MDFEENDLHITNEDGRSPSEENNRSQQGSEVFADAQEHFSPEEQNIKLPEENLLGSSSSTKDKEEEKKKRAGKVDASKTAKTLSQSLGAAVSLPTIAVSLVTAVTVIGTTTGLISPLPSHDVSIFMSRSHELGFVMKGNANQAYLLSLFGGDYKVEEEVSGGQQYVFSDLQPNTVYNLDVFDMNVEPFRKVLSKSYLTKERDLYSAFVNNVAMAQSMLTFNVDYEGEDVGFVTVTVTDEAGNVLFLYEGAPQDSFTVDTKGNESVHITVSINGETVHYEPVYAIPQQWVFDETNHWHTDGDEIIDLAEHSFVEEILKEATFEEVGSAKKICSICHYETSPYELPKKEHQYDLEHWAKDETNHWHACTDEGYGDLRKDQAEHTWVDKVITEPTYEEPGLGKKVCSVCGYTDGTTYSIAKLEHHFDTDKWEFNEDTHWRPCTDEGYEDLRGNEAEHTLVEHIVSEATYEAEGSAYKECSVCGYKSDEYALPKLEHRYAEEWATNETNHWHACTDEGYEDLTDGLGSHEFGDPTLEDGYIVKTCDVCGYVDRTPAESENAAAFTYTPRTGEEAFDISGIDMSVMDDYEWNTVTLPNIHNGLPIKGIVGSALENVSIQNLTIPSSFDYIGEGALYNQNQLVSLNVPFIGEKASNTEGTASFFVYIFGQQNYGTYEHQTFSVGLGENTTYYVPSSLQRVEVHIPNEDPYTMSAGAMTSLESVTDIVIDAPGGIHIGNAGFVMNPTVENKTENITFQGPVLSIGNSAFGDNPVTSLTLESDTVAEFESRLSDFDDDWDADSMLTSITCKDGVYSLFPDGCEIASIFEYYSPDDTNYYINGVNRRRASVVDLTNVTLPTEFDGHPVIGIYPSAFRDISIKNLTIPSSYRYLQNGALYNQYELESLTIPFMSENPEIDFQSTSTCLAWLFGSSEFSVGASECYLVSNVDKATNGYAGYIPKSLERLTIDRGDNDLEIFSYGLAGLSYLKNITLRANHITLDDHAFADYGENALIENVTLSGTLSSIGQEAFRDNPLTTLTYTGTTADFLSTKSSFDDNWLSSSSLTEVKCSDGSIDPRTLFAPDENVFEYEYSEALGGYAIMGAVTDSSVLNSYNWDTVTLPTEYNDKPVVGIGAGSAFISVKIKHLIIPATYTEIAQGALKGQDELESISLPFVGENKNMQGEASVFGFIFGNTEYDNSYELGYGSYSYSAYIPNSLSSVTIDAGTENLVLRDHAMRGLDKVKDITIRAASITIPAGAFALESSEPEDATLLLDAPTINITGSAFGLRTSITFSGTRQQWQAMEISSSWPSDWFADAGDGFKVHCSDGDISY